MKTKNNFGGHLVGLFSSWWEIRVDSDSFPIGAR